MGCCRVCLILLLVIPAVFFGCLCLPGAERAYIRAVDTYVVPVPIARHFLQIAGQARHIWKVGGGIAVGPVWNPLLAYAVDAHKTGVGLFPSTTAPATSYMVSRLSHASARAVHYNPKLKRDSSVFVTVDTSKVPEGYFLPGVLPTLLQLNTDSDSRYAHRDLLSAVMPALAENPDVVPDFKPAPGISANDLIQEVSTHLIFPFPKMVPSKVQDVFAFNFFRHTFEVDLTSDEIHTLKEWLRVHFRTIFGMGSAAGGAQCAQLAKVLEEKMASGKIGQQLMEEAERRGMNGRERLRKTLFELSFAGFGGDGPGGALATFKLLRLLQRAPETNIPLFKRNPGAFVLEVLRTQGGGGAGVNPWITEETTTHTLGTGFTVEEKAGTYGSTIALMANHDPAVFGGPHAQEEFASAFIPGRENADRLLTFVAELRDIRQCPNVTGCVQAPRFCLGAFLVQRLMIQIGLVGVYPHRNRFDFDYMVKRAIIDLERDNSSHQGRAVNNSDDQDMLIASPLTPPELQTPPESLDSDTEMLPEDDVLLLMSSPIWITPDDDDILTDALDAKKMQDLPSSTASTAPPSPTCSMPCTSAAVSPPNRDFLWQLEREKELSALSRDELRQELGLDGTDVAENWSRHDLLITLVEMEKVIPDMSRLAI
ncbi:unnamed protein product [Symbiodinium sp. CCMP2456]|nr:unnamed protein product [Symbiodinium sp. CCMP2456]